MIFNLSSGKKSQIIVTADTGSTVTCSKGTTVKTANEENGTWTFVGLSLGTWTITATSANGNTKTKTVTFEKHSTAYVEIVYDHIVFKSGSGFVNGHSYSVGGSIIHTVNASKIHVEGTSQSNWGYFNITPKTNLTKYSKLVLTVSVTWVGSNGGVKIGVGTATNTDSMAASRTIGYHGGTLSIDISNVNTSAYILIDPLYCDVDITSIKLEA